MHGARTILFPLLGTGVADGEPGSRQLLQRIGGSAEALPGLGIAQEAC